MQLKATPSKRSTQRLMDIFMMAIVAAILIAAAVYAHTRIPRFTAGTVKLKVAHAVLIAVGLAAGAVGALINRADPLIALFSLPIGFGVVHVPAAFILFFKQQRQSGKT